MQNKNELYGLAVKPSFNQLMLERFLEVSIETRDTEQVFHEIGYVSIFSDMEKANQFCTWIEKQNHGLVVVLIEEIEGEYHIAFKPTGNMEREDVDKCSIRAFLKTVELNGVHDGWIALPKLHHEYLDRRVIH